MDHFISAISDISDLELTLTFLTWPVPNVLQVLLVVFATDLASWACQPKVRHFFRRIPTFFLGGETLPKYLGEKFLSIPLTDWKLSKRNRPKLRSNPFKSNSQAAKQFTELQDASLQKKKLQNGFLQRCGCPFFFPVFQNILGFLVVGDTASLRLLAAGPTTRDQKGLYLSTRGGLTSSKILPTLKLPQERLEYATARTKKLC